jgi:hypothetical protein
MTSVLRATLLTALTAASAAAQQLPDSSFRPPVPRPAYATAAGPRLCLDEAHHNFHTLDNRFYAFGELARRDGYRVSPNRAAFTTAALGACDILVISNAQNGIPWPQQPAPTPSAFTAAEIAAVRTWVDSGGALLLIADHQPLAGAARDLAAAFGARFIDGFAYKGWTPGSDDAGIGAAMGEPTYFVAGTTTLPAHPISRGRDTSERVTRVQSFTGQAFLWDVLGVQPVLVLPDDYVSLEPRYAWQFDNLTPIRRVGGWLQGATVRVGRGRAAFFGEAVMFSAQVAGPNRTPMGMNAPTARQNPRFVLNTLHWLSGLLDR